MKNRVLPGIHWSDRIRQITFFAFVLAIGEYTFPTPFLQSPWGRILWAAISFYVIKALFRKRQETSPRFYRKTQRRKAKWEKRKLKLSDNARFRMYRLVRMISGLYIWGWFVNTVTEKCDEAVACVAATPSIIAANFADLIMVVMSVAFSMLPIFAMMWFMARMDLFTEILPDSITTRFSDVYGQDKAVARVKENLAILNNPEKVESLGGYMPGGILLTGPPGTGKTYIAEAAAGETGKPFIMVGPDSFTNMFVGVPVLKVKMIFRHLRKTAIKYGGVVIFFDEIDALGSRGQSVTDHSETEPWIRRLINKVIVTGGAAGSGALQMLLTEMSGMQKPKGFYNKLRVMAGFKPNPPPKYRILWMAATNLPEALDAALLRPGRYDRQIRVNYPDKQGRIDTLKGYLNKVPNNVTSEQIKLLATNNPQATGASIKDIVNEALLKAIRENRDIVTWEDIRDSIIWKGLGEELGRQNHEEDNKRVTLHEASHAVAALLWRKHTRIQFASVVRRGNTGGVVSATPIEERFTKTRNELESEILVSLASVWAEKFYFEDNISTGPSSDLENASRLAKAMWAKYAMGSSLFVCEPDQLGPEQLEEVRDYLHELYEQLSEVMYKYRDIVEAIAQLLDEQGTVDGEEIEKLFERMK